MEPAANSAEDIERDWRDLPVELLTLVLSRLFFEDYTRFRSVCKAWHDVPTPAIHPCQCPIKPSQWLMFSQQNSSTFHFSHPLYKRTCVTDLQDLSDAILRYSKDGWLLMTRGDYSLFFVNPFTNEKIDLPDIPGPERYLCNGICFTSSPTATDSMVFGIFGYPDLQYLLFIRSGDEEWTYLKRETAVDFEPSNCNPVFYNEFFVCLVRDGKLGVFDPKGNFWWRVLDQPQPPFGIVDESYLVECNGHLLSVFLDNHGEVVSLYRLDERTMAWKTVKDLGDMMLFVSHCSSFAVKKEVNGMENKIYFPRFDEEGDGIFYCLGTKMFQTFYTDFSSNKLYNTNKKLHCCWIEPNSTKL